MILDTNALSALFAGDRLLAEVLATEDRHHLPAIVIGEYRYGLIRSSDRGRLSRLLDLLITESIVLPIDEETAEHYARIRDHLRRNGRPIPENDVWIASLARQHDQEIVSRDDHFDAVAEVRRVEW